MIRLEAGFQEGLRAPVVNTVIVSNHTGLRHAGKMKKMGHILHRMLQRVSIAETADDVLHLIRSQRAPIARLAYQTPHWPAASGQLSDEMNADKSCSPCHQGAHPHVLTYT